MYELLLSIVYDPDEDMLPKILSKIYLRGEFHF